MLEALARLTVLDVIYAALLAFVLTQFILSIKKVRSTAAKIKAIKNPNGEIEMMAILKQCKKMFPLSTINFRGKVFTTGMKVRITTLQKRIIEGEIIGRNEDNVLCVFTGKHIIAHELNKIEDITEIAG